MVVSVSHGTYDFGGIKIMFVVSCGLWIGLMYDCDVTMNFEGDW